MGKIVDELQLTRDRSECSIRGLAQLFSPFDRLCSYLSKDGISAARDGGN